MEFLVEHDNVSRALKVFGRFLHEKPSKMRIRKEKESIKRIKRNRRLARKF